VTIANIEKLEIPSDMGKTIQGVVSKMGLSHDTTIEKDIDLAAAAAHKLLLINPEKLNLWNKDEQEFIIAHECSHIKNNDYLRDGYYNLAILPISYGILQGYDFLTSKCLAHVKEKYAKEGDKLDKSINFVKGINKTISNSVVCHHLLSVFLLNAISRYMEFRADKEAAICLKNIRGAISFFSRLDFRDYGIGLSELDRWDILKMFLELADELPGMSTHPSSSARITALETIMGHIQPQQQPN
jgi:Zn-dependent protease with chaperone function